jgi:hypothetical protein
MIRKTLIIATAFLSLTLLSFADAQTIEEYGMKEMNELQEFENDVWSPRSV